MFRCFIQQSPDPNPHLSFVDRWTATCEERFGVTTTKFSMRSTRTSIEGDSHMWFQDNTTQSQTLLNVAGQTYKYVSLHHQKYNLILHWGGRSVPPFKRYPAGAKQVRGRKRQNNHHGYPITPTPTWSLFLLYPSLPFVAFLLFAGNSSQKLGNT